MSWGHDEYLYQTEKNFLCEEGACVIRYHSLYCVRKDEEYQHLMNEKDHRLMPWVRIFSDCDLYSKSPDTLDVEKLIPYYKELVSEFIPGLLNW